MIVVLCRHGETEANAEGRFLSRTDVPLSPHGREQSLVLRDAFAAMHLERCFVSPLRRCLETREIVAPELPYEVCSELREIDFGAWEGETLDALEQRFPDQVASRRRDPVRFRPAEGESFEDVAARIAPLATRLRALHEPALVIGHRGGLGVLERLLRGLPLDSREVIPLEPAAFRIVRASSFRPT